MFQNALRDIVDKTEGGVAGLIMDSEGIPVESYARDDAPFDITTIGVEFGVVLGSIKRAADSGGAFVATITRLGGCFGIENLSPHVDARQGALAVRQRAFRGLRRGQRACSAIFRGGA